MLHPNKKGRLVFFLAAITILTAQADIPLAQAQEDNNEVEIIVPREGLVTTTDFDIQYQQESVNSSQAFDSLVSGDEGKPESSQSKSSSSQNTAITGSLYLEEHLYPDLSIMEAIMSSALTKLLPNKLGKQVTIKTAEDFSGQAKHYVYGLYQEAGLIVEDAYPAETPSQRTEAPEWWQKAIGESKILCGLFNTCDSPQSLSIEIASPKDSSAPPKKTGNQNGQETQRAEIADTTIEKESFSTVSLIQQAIEKVTEYIKGLFETDNGSVLAWFLKTSQKTTISSTTEEGESTLKNKTRGNVPGLESINENTNFFRNFLDSSLLVGENGQVSAALATKAKYQTSGELLLGPGSEKINYQNLGTTQRNYCLALCSQYPSGYPISQIDPLCPSCDLDDYQLTGYGDVILSKDLCRPENGACHYYEEPNGTNEGCGENQDPNCENNRCNPYELYTDDYVNFCSKIPEYGNCRDEDVCYIMTFAPNPSGGYGECQYANPDICVRADRIQVGECAAVCNWACCEWQQ